MPFYFPLTLGIRRRRTPEQKQQGAARPAPPEGWREGVHLAGVEYDEHPADRVLGDLRRVATAGQSRRPWFVLGGPGAGKSALLERYFDDWTAELPPPSIGLTVPVLVRLRELGPRDLENDAEAAADRLWREHGTSSGAARCAGAPAENIYRAGLGRALRPLWLLDGLDELEQQLEGQRLYEWLVALPGAKLVTCRTAVFETLRGWVEGQKEREFDILPLKTAEQESFLAGVLEARGSDPTGGKAIQHAIQSNPALRALAGNPLMLGLIADVADRIALPTTRSAFYREVVEAMWHRKVPRPGAENLLTARDRLLIELAQEMGLERLEHSLVSLLQKCEEVATGQGQLLQDALKRAGLLAVDPRRGVCFFPHLTFQEFYVARALEPRGLRQPLEQHWADARYEETLALLASLLREVGRMEEVDQAMSWLLEWGSRIYRRNPGLLGRMRRSPLRVVLHLLRRAGASWEELRRTKYWLEGWLRSSSRGRHAIASDTGAPGEVLAALACDRDPLVRNYVAHNPAAPPQVLTALAHDGNGYVRKGVAQNATAPAEVLADLARDVEEVTTFVAELGQLAPPSDRNVRSLVGSNPSTPADVLAALARDNAWNVRVSVASNPSTPSDVFAALECDKDLHVRQAVAQNSAAPPQVLANFARKGSFLVARSTATLMEVLGALPPGKAQLVRGVFGDTRAARAEIVAALIRRHDALLRRHGEFSATSAEALSALKALRRDDEENSAIVPEVLSSLDYVDENFVLRSVAQYSTSPELLTALALGHFTIHIVLADNSAVPGEVLAALTRDNSVHSGLVQMRVALNSAAPANLLAALARDGTPMVRMNVASNPSTPPEVLAALTCDENSDVRETVVENPAAPPDAINALARDDVAKVRFRVAYCTRDVDVLTMLVRDQSDRVREAAALNRNFLLEDLTPQGFLSRLQAACLNLLASARPT